MVLKNPIIRMLIMTGGLILPLFFVEGCLCARDSLRQVRIERESTREVIVSSACAKVNDKGLKVFGILDRGRKYTETENGHLDLCVLASNGQVLANAKINYLPRPIPRNRGGRGSSRYEVQFDFILPADAVVRVRYHGAAINDCSSGTMLE